MKTEDWDRLLEKYLEGETTLKEEQKLRNHFAGQNVPDKDKAESDILSAFSELRQLKSNRDLPDSMFIENETIRTGGSTSFRTRGLHVLGRVAAVLILTLGGFAAGIWYANNGPARIKNGNADLLETRFEQASASERVRFIRAEYDKSGENNTIKQILIRALNNDDNVNVRLAAAEALYHFRSDQSVRKALIRSLPNQTDPNVQIALIDMLVRLHEKKAVPEMQVMLLKKDLNPVVRYKLEDGVGTLS